MNKQTEKQLGIIKASLTGVISTFDRTTASEFMSDLADWAYEQYETLTYDNEPADTTPDEQPI